MEPRLPLGRPKANGAPSGGSKPQAQRGGINRIWKICP